jgi:hypothetical protein
MFPFVLRVTPKENLTEDQASIPADNPTDSEGNNPHEYTE